MNLKDKTIVVTGATGGIGSILSQKLKDLGSNVITIGRDPKKEATYHADLSDPASRHELTATLLTNYPKIDILINCAGIGIYKPGTEISEKEWNTTYELNVHTPFFLSQSLNPTITVNIGSCSALQHHPARTLYNSSKAALRLATLCLADENPGSFVHLTLDSTLTSFGSLSIDEKKAKQQAGKFYLDPDWVTREICNIIQLDELEAEYTLSPECYEHCGIWHKPQS